MHNQTATFPVGPSRFMFILSSGFQILVLREGSVDIILLEKYFSNVQPMVNQTGEVNNIHVYGQKLYLKFLTGDEGGTYFKSKLLFLLSQRPL